VAPIFHVCNMNAHVIIVFIIMISFTNSDLLMKLCALLSSGVFKGAIGRCPPKDFLAPKCRLKRRLTVITNH